MASKRLNSRQKAIKITVAGIIKHAINGVQFDIFDLQQITEAGDKAAQKYIDGEHAPHHVIESEIKTAVNAAVAKYRKN